MMGKHDKDSDKSIELYEQLNQAFKTFIKTNPEVNLSVVLLGIVMAFARMISDRQCAMFDIDSENQKRLDLFALLSKKLMGLVAETDSFLDAERKATKHRG